MRSPGRGPEDLCLSEEGSQARHSGRLIIVRVDMPSGMQVTVISAYRWSGAFDSGLLRESTNSPLIAVRLEARARRAALVLVAMDLSGYVQGFEQLIAALNGGEIWDMGAAEHWDLDGAGCSLPPCRAHGSKQGTRRDYPLLQRDRVAERRRFSAGWGEFGILDAHPPDLWDVAHSTQRPRHLEAQEATAAHTGGYERRGHKGMA